MNSYVIKFKYRQFFWNGQNFGTTDRMEFSKLSDATSYAKRVVEPLHTGQWVIETILENLDGGA